MLWLENRVVRTLEVQARGPLQVGKPGDTAWDEAFEAYLDECSCPSTVPRGNIESCLLWLTGHAVAVAYEDGSETIRSRAATAHGAAPIDVSAAEEGATDASLTEKGVAASSSASSLSAGAEGEADPVAPSASALPAALSSADAATVAAGVSKLCKALGVEEADGATPQSELLERCVTQIRHRILPAIRAAEADGGTTTPLAGGVALSDLRGMSSGVLSGNERVDAAVQVLRLLYLDALRGAQDTANGILEAVQAFTADPRTDTSLGRVGR